jgi:hypothetical protein
MGPLRRTRWAKDSRQSSRTRTGLPSGVKNVLYSVVTFGWLLRRASAPSSFLNASTMCGEVSATRKTLSATARPVPSSTARYTVAKEPVAISAMLV